METAAEYQEFTLFGGAGKGRLIATQPHRARTKANGRLIALGLDRGIESSAQSEGIASKGAMMKTTLCLVGLMFLTASAYGQATIKVLNSALSRMQLDTGAGVVPVPTTVSLYYGVFVNGSNSPTLPLFTSSTSTAGLISGEGDTLALYVIPDLVPGEYVPMQVRAWSSAFGADWQGARASGAYYGETDVRTVAPGTPAGPGTGIWQSQSGIDSHRFHPIVVTGIGPQVGDILVDDITVAEGSNGVVNANFIIRLTGPSTQTISVDFATQEGTALAGQDYVATHGTVTFAPGETSKTVTVLVTGDGPPEEDEVFTLGLSNASSGIIRRGSGSCVITEARINLVRLDTAVIFHTLAGRRYAVESSPDMQTWTSLPNGANVLGGGGPMTVYDEGTSCSGVRYYRTRLLSP